MYGCNNSAYIALKTWSKENKTINRETDYDLTLLMNVVDLGILLSFLCIHAYMRIITFVCIYV